ncbi:MAG TPA: hypothetical protein PK122_01840 [Candidatus Paceibacterota bacterium]|nr:hypothetical protein [Candidatus Paceibacterota bacterium]
MRARFIRGQDPKKAMGIGTDAKVEKFLESIANDYQMDPNDPQYLGFVNVYEDGFFNSDEKDGFIEFVRTWPRYKPMMDRLGINVEDNPDIEETVFIRPVKGIKFGKKNPPN